MSLVMWRDGAPFDRFMNRYMGVPFPNGFDPSKVPSLLGNLSLMSGFEKMNTTSLMTGLAMGDDAFDGDVATA